MVSRIKLLTPISVTQWASSLGSFLVSKSEWSTVVNAGSSKRNLRKGPRIVRISYSFTRRKGCGMSRACLQKTRPWYVYAEHLNISWCKPFDLVQKFATSRSGKMNGLAAGFMHFASSSLGISVFVGNLQSSPVFSATSAA